MEESSWPAVNLATIKTDSSFESWDKLNPSDKNATDNAC